MTLKATINARISATHTGSHPFGGLEFAAAMEEVLNLSDGTAANQADILYAGERTVGDGADDDLDLAGALSDVFGAAIASAELVALFVINKPRNGAANTTDLTIGGGSNPVDGFLGGTAPVIGPLKPGAIALLASPGADGLGAVDAGTADILRIGNSAGASNTYQIIVIGRSA